MLARLSFPLALACAGSATTQHVATDAAPGAVGIGPRWSDITVEWTERRYKVEAVRFKARDETGIDALGSDESDADVCAGWLLPDYSFTCRTTRLPDVRTDFRSQLLAAMDRTGIALADGAAATPPRPAETEVETATAAAGR